MVERLPRLSVIAGHLGNRGKGKENTMLVLTRRENEKIVFPAIDTSIEILEVKAGRVRLGIAAPPELQVLREEVMKADNGKLASLEKSRQAFAVSMLRKTKHKIANQMNAATVGLALAQRQLQAGMIDGVEETLKRIGAGIHTLEEQMQGLVDQAQPLKRSTAVPQALLVEDDTNECELLAGFLRMAGYKVNTAFDGADALDKLRNGMSPDVMLLDMNMPRCDGATTVRLIRREPTWNALKIFAVTGYSANELGVDQATIGIDRWFRKPLNPEALLGELDAARTKLMPA